MLRSAIGFLVLRRRGVYFSLLTLALSALVYSVAFRWTAFTGGENGLGGLTRANWFGADLENRWVYYALVASVGLATVYGLSRFHASPIGSVLNAIRENEQRAQFIGYPTARYKLVAFVLSSVLTGFAGVLFAFHHRFASADPTAVSFSGELLAMVIIGGMRSLLGPALGALFYILFREYLSIWTATLAVVLRTAVRRLHRVFAERVGGSLAAGDRATGASGASKRRRWPVVPSSTALSCRRSFARMQPTLVPCSRPMDSPNRSAVFARCRMQASPSAHARCMH